MEIAKMLLCVFAVFQCSLVFVTCDAKMLASVIQNIMQCVSEAPKGFSIDVCHEMLNKGNDNTQEKYKQCKCVAACTGKRLGLINENGEGNPEKYRSFIGMTNNEEWAKEAEIIAEKCRHVKNTDACDYAHEWITCALTNSPKTMEFVKAFAGDFQASQQ